MPENADRTQSMEQTLALAGRAWSWLVMAGAIRQPRDTSRDAIGPGIVRMDPHDYYAHLASTHMVVLAFHHADRCLRLVGSRWPDAFPSAEADRFISAWAPLRDLRDVLEHEEDYIAGEGLKPQLLGPSTGWSLGRDNVRVPHHSSGHHFDSEGRPSAITALGKTYDLTPAIKAARALLGPLGAYLQPPATEQSPSRKLTGWGYVYNATIDPVTLPNGDVVQPGALYSEGTIIADPLPEGMWLLERADRWNPATEEWDADERSFVPRREAADSEAADGYA